MHSRHRNGPGMYRSNSMGFGGVGSATRNISEGSMRGPRMHNNEYRNYSDDDCGRSGRSRHFAQASPPQEVDIFVEAGRLAAEYLVSKGVLPPDALSGKWQTDVRKNQAGNFQEFRHHQGDRTQPPANGRASVHSRLGNADVDAGSSGKRKYFDEYSLLDSRSSSRERKRTGSFKNHGIEVDRDPRRAELWAEKSGSSFGKEANGDTSMGHNIYTEHPVIKDGNFRAQTSSSPEVTQEIVRETRTEAVQNLCSLAEEADASNSTLTNEKCPPCDKEEQIKRNDDADKLDDVTMAVEEEKNDDGLRQQDGKGKEVASTSTEGTSVIEDHFDLAKDVKFLNFPKRTRSSLLGKGSKGDLDPMNKDLNPSKNELSEGPHAMDDDIESSGGNTSAQESHELKPLQSGISNVLLMEEEPSVSEKSSPKRSLMSGSLTEPSQFIEQEGNKQPLQFQSSNSMFTERGEKETIDHDSDNGEDSKKVGQWFPSLETQPDSSLPLSGPMEDQPSAQEPETSPSANIIPSPEPKTLDRSLLAKGRINLDEFAEEKQLFPSSFRTCDLNLLGNSNANENRDADPMLMFPPITQEAKTGTPVGVNLPMSISPMPTKHDEHSVEDNAIEVIDLDSDCAPEHQTFSNPERRDGTVFADMDEMLNNIKNGNVVPDVQDGYGIMISELLANDGTNCSVPADMNSLQNNMGLPNTEGMLGDDDSIYMSLGEIPISLLGPWEQPPQDFGKPF